MNSTNKILLGLLALQAVVLVGTSLGREDRAVVKSVAVVGEVKADDISRIEIAGPPGSKQESIVLARIEDGWGIETADGFPAKTEAADDLAKKLAGLRSSSVVVTSDRYHDKLEVSESKYVRRLRITTGDETIEVFVGSSPSFKNTHVRRADSSDVYLVSDLSTSDVAERAWNWVDRAYVDIPAEDVWSVQIENAQGKLQLERDPTTDEWAAVGVPGALKKTAVDDLVRKARSVNLESPVGKTVEPEHGLERPAATVRLVVGTSTIAGTPPPSTETRSFRVGAKVAGQNRYYVKADDSEYVVEAAEYAVKALVEKTRADLLDDD